MTKGYLVGHDLASCRAPNLPYRHPAAHGRFRILTSHLRQSPAHPSCPVQHARVLWVGIPLTGRAVRWKLTEQRLLGVLYRQREDVNTLLFTVPSEGTVSMCPNRRPASFLICGMVSFSLMTNR